MKVHHAVFCVHGENQERAADLWRGLGLTFSEIVLADLEIRVLIDWDAGIELVSPLHDAGEPALAFTTFLETQGEGLYSLAMSVDEVDGPEAIALRYGAQVEYRQHRDLGSFVIDEVMLAPVHGMPITFLSVNEKT
jgi:hypothetical protein